MFIRRDVWSLQPWDPILTWYEKAIATLLKVDIDKPTSWKSLAAMHGINVDAWRIRGYLPASGPGPVIAPQWDQCQHQSWYFLPWHRGYVAGLEAIVRQTIVDLGGPTDWALPYWNYNGTKPHSIELPTAFSTPKKPDGTPNALWTAARYGTDGKGHINMKPAQIDPSKALNAPTFADDFGGPETTFHHGGGSSGLLEQQPHNVVHSLVGGQTVSNPTKWDQVGLMSVPATAALDPIFWLHHANIDRMWEVWLAANPKHANPPATGTWGAGPPATGRAFEFPGPDGKWRAVKVNKITSAKDLGYRYDDTVTPHQHIAAAASAPAGAQAAALTASSAMPPGPSHEFAANPGAMRLGATFAETSVRVDKQSKPPAKAFAAAIAASGAGHPESRVLLSLDGIRSAAGSNVISDGVLIDVLVASPDNGEEHVVGTISMFGLTQASDPADVHGGGGLTQVLDITDSYQALQSSGALDDDKLTVRFRSSTELSDMSNISIGKVRLLNKS